MKSRYKNGTQLTTVAFRPGKYRKVKKYCTENNIKIIDFFDTAIDIMISTEQKKLEVWFDSQLISSNIIYTKK